MTPAPPAQKGKAMSQAQAFLSETARSWLPPSLVMSVFVGVQTWLLSSTTSLQQRTAVLEAKVQDNRSQLDRIERKLDKVLEEERHK